MHELFQISFAARVAMNVANFVIFFILASHARNRHISQEGSNVFWLIVSFAGVSFATSCMFLWDTIVVAGLNTGLLAPKYLLSNVVTMCSIIMILFAVPLIRVLTLPSRTVWFSTVTIFISAVGAYIWAGEYLQ